MPRQHWLMKSEPYVYSIDDLERDGTTHWDGVRNYAARNLMRDKMRIGDRVLFYHSNAKPPGVAGIAEVCRESYPDFTQFDASNKYFDPKATEENPRLVHGRHPLRGEVRARGGAPRDSGYAGVGRDGAGEPQPALGAAGERSGIRAYCRDGREPVVIPRRPSPASRGQDPGVLHGLLALIGGATICLACTGAPDDLPQTEVGEWELVEDLRLDANAEDFSVVSWVYVGPQGEIVVPERQDYRVRVYDSTGTLMLTIGRRGEGPGEFQAPAPVFWAADTLVVFDMGLGPRDVPAAGRDSRPHRGWLVFSTGFRCPGRG